MALINCPDCGNQVSDQATACPKCARPISQPQLQVAASSGDNGAGLYFLGFLLAWVIFFVRSYSASEGVIYGFFVAWLSWLYVGYALIAAIFA